MKPKWSDRTPYRFAPFPKCILEEWLHLLDLPCLRVYTYLLLRTWGHRTRRAAVPVAEIASGQVNAKGKRVDHGTGLSTRTVRRTIQKLAALRLVAVTHDHGKVAEYQVETAWSGAFSPVSKQAMEKTLKESVLTYKDRSGHSSVRTPPVTALSAPTSKLVQ